ncbi:MAG TPA: hypothetical protein VMW04_03125 [Patescibacteria group bacterium]|nr:hypothetical protein [Patescibacteria group bacterium]
MSELYSAKSATRTEKAEPAEKPNKKRDFLPDHQGSSLSSLWVLPSKAVRFETQEPEEEILMILRAHWVTNILWFLLATILFFAPFLLRFFPLLDSFPVRFQLMFVVVWYMVLAMYVFERFLSWFFNLTLITDERIIDVDFLNLTTKKVSDADIDKIQDVSFTNAGAVGAIFNYGDVLVQTAAEIVEFIFEKVPNPAGVANVLQRLRTEEKIEAIEGRVR